MQDPDEARLEHNTADLFARTSALTTNSTEAVYADAEQLGPITPKRRACVPRNDDLFARTGDDLIGRALTVGESGGASALLHYGPKHTPLLELELDFQQGDKRYRYAARLAFAAGDKLVYDDEAVSVQPPKHATMHVEAGARGFWESQLNDGAALNASVQATQYWLSQLTSFHFHDTSPTSALRTNARASDDQLLRSDGGNLAAYLLRLEQSADEADRKAWKRINAYVTRVAPSVKTLAPTLNDNGSATVRLDWIDDQDERFGAHQLSDGTLRAIALVTALAQPVARLPRFMSIDEPELGLHPAALRVIAELARCISHHAQVLFATQSTAFLDRFAPEEVVVVERRHGMSSLVRPDAGMLRTWLDDYSLSEVFDKGVVSAAAADRKSTRLNSSH